MLITIATYVFLVCASAIALLVTGDAIVRGVRAWQSLRGSLRADSVHDGEHAAFPLPHAAIRASLSMRASKTFPAFTQPRTPAQQAHIQAEPAMRLAS